MMASSENNIEKKNIFSLKTLLYFAVAIAVLIDLAYVYLNHGHAGIMQNAKTSEPVFESSEIESYEGVVEIEDGQVIHNDGVYQYKEGMMTFLITCVDETADNSTGAETFLLMVMDSNSKHIDYFPISCNTIYTHDKAGEPVTLEQAALAAETREQGAEVVLNAVSKYFHKLPIHGFVSMTADGVVPLNDALGGVNVKVPADYEENGKTLKEGVDIHLEGDETAWFLTFEDEENPDSKSLRQDAYVRAVISKLYYQIKDDPVSFMNIYDAVDEYTLTNMTRSELTYIATEAASYDFDNKSLHIIEGETVDNNGYAQFVTDEEALKNQIIDVFYDRVRDYSN